jgi:hypothetical protein
MTPNDIEYVAWGQEKRSCHEEGWVNQQVVRCIVLCSTLSFSCYFISLRHVKFSSPTTRLVTKCIVLHAT